MKGLVMNSKVLISIRKQFMDEYKNEYPYENKILIK
jgi:hypothetical protein